jgi:hypothetical protein
MAQRDRAQTTKPAVLQIVNMLRPIRAAMQLIQ